jgi:hypothetical protein
VTNYRKKGNEENLYHFRTWYLSDQSIKRRVCETQRRTRFMKNTEFILCMLHWRIKYPGEDILHRTQPENYEQKFRTREIQLEAMNSEGMPEFTQLMTSKTKIRHYERELKT